jgi:RimJ/RimL family protein N-acetyltransferase/ribosomal protein S18 acetylase RimI-like enzyme
MTRQYYVSRPAVDIDVDEEPREGLSEYATVPIAFEVREVFDAEDLAGTPGRRLFTVLKVEPPYVKDYDAIARNQPSDWPTRFNLDNWAFFVARMNGVRVGAAAVALESPTVAALWDIRVAPAARRQSVGFALLSAVEAWASNHGAIWLEAETQHINVPAYRFYLHHDFTLTSVRAGAYPELPDEIQLLLHKKLPGPHDIPDEITTPRLVLTRRRVSDAAELKAVIDANLVHLQAWMPWAMAEPSPLQAIEERSLKFEADFDRGLEWGFAIRLRASGELVGGAGLHPRIGPDGLEIGYWLRSDATGKGYATEATDALTRVALRQPGVLRVEIRCDPNNVASAAIPRRLGFKHVLTIENETTTPSGSPRDTMVWEKI